MTPRLMRAEAVRRTFDPPCGREAAYALMRRLGGWYEPGVGWVVFAARVSAYLKQRERDQQGITCHEPKGSTAYPSTNEKDTGSATSSSQTDDAVSAPCTSAQTEAEKASAPPSPPTGKSKHALRLESMLASERKQRSAARSKPSMPSRS